MRTSERPRSNSIASNCEQTKYSNLIRICMRREVATARQDSLKTHHTAPTSLIPPFPFYKPTPLRAESVNLRPESRRKNRFLYYLSGTDFWQRQHVSMESSEGKCSNSAPFGTYQGSLEQKWGNIYISLARWNQKIGFG
ncbi:hypothetical protein CDAR_76321 [Caerostris darwini]|uniref:Uncharacterized protein n=1 Tax=Caerostris darwini TaxID=1538125 RepID=A0AAV4PY60_9ARAC|nr:hypothetical protein CDAR_76321 [Caerostris darwini]